MTGSENDRLVAVESSLTRIESRLAAIEKNQTTGFSRFIWSIGLTAMTAGMSLVVAKVGGEVAGFIVFLAGLIVSVMALKASPGKKPGTSSKL